MGRSAGDVEGGFLFGDELEVVLPLLDLDAVAPVGEGGGGGVSVTSPLLFYTNSLSNRQANLT